VSLFKVFYRNVFDTSAVALFRAVPGVADPREFREVFDVEADDLEHVFRLMNVVDGDELPVKLGIRSLSVGDVVLRAADATLWHCSAFGWEQTKWGR
jgi:hypothetical protein